MTTVTFTPASTHRLRIPHPPTNNNIRCTGAKGFQKSKLRIALTIVNAYSCSIGDNIFFFMGHNEVV